MSVKGKALSESLAFWRAERPDEWTMDEFIRDAAELEAKYKALEARIKELEDMLLGDAENPQVRIDELLEQQREACAEMYEACYGKSTNPKTKNAIRNARIDK